VAEGNYLVMVDETTDQEIRQAELIFRQYGIHGWEIYSPSYTTNPEPTVITHI